ncbi:MAG: DUF1858 domain-containing protein [Thermodesulfobacteriota bacterium]
MVKQDTYSPRMILLDGKMTIQELLVAHPAAMDVLVRHHMVCIGCPAQAFHTLEEVARAYGYEPSALFDIIARAIEAAEPA